MNNKYFKAWLAVFFCALLSASAVLSVQLGVEELAELLIEQKDYHLGSDKQRFEASVAKIYSEAGVETFWAVAPGVIPGQPAVPVVVFKPASATDANPAKLIIHVHGGPRVLMTPGSLHAEISYFLSHGFVVVAPNFRGSLIPDADEHMPANLVALLPELRKLQILPKGLEEIYGPQDVYATARFALKLPYVSQDPVFLRGGSFGSFINSHLLAQKNQRVFADLNIAGVHLSAGPDYPDGSEMPADTTILLTHGLLDSIVPISGGVTFLEQAKAAGLRNVLPFFSEFGDHHNINPQLCRDDRSSAQYRELRAYAQSLSALVLGGHFNLKELRYGGARAELKAQPARPSPAARGPLSPTIAHLKLVLGPKFSGEVERDLWLFYTKHFDPVNFSWYSSCDFDFRGPQYMGAKILKNKQAFGQLVDMVEEEQQVFRAHPEQMVFYHAAHLQTMQLFQFFTMWDRLLNGSTGEDLTVMRASTVQAEIFGNIKSFLTKMRRTASRSEKSTFNNSCGFQDVAIAVTTWITFHQNTASCSAWWFAGPEGVTNTAPLEKEIKSFLKSQGLPEDRAAKYLLLFDRYKDKGPQELMQQIFVPQALAAKYSYMCEHWGYEIGSNPEGSSVSDTASFVPFLGRNLAGYEDLLRRNHDCFNYPEKVRYSAPRVSAIREHCPDISGGMQARLLLHPELTAEMKVKSWYKNQKLAEQLRAELEAIISEDIDYLASGGARRHLSDQEKLYRIQKSLVPGHVGDVDVEGFIELNRRLSRSDKKEVHTRIKAENLPQMADSICAFANYTHGYTYYDLLIEAAEDPKSKFGAQARESIINFLNQMASPKSAQTYLPRDAYSQMYQLLGGLKSHARYDYGRHTILSEEYVPGLCFATDFGYGAELALRVARAAKNVEPLHWPLADLSEDYPAMAVPKRARPVVSHSMNSALREMAYQLGPIATEENILIFGKCLRKNVLSRKARVSIQIYVGYLATTVGQQKFSDIGDEELLEMLKDMFERRK